MHLLSANSYLFAAIGMTETNSLLVMAVTAVMVGFAAWLIWRAKRHKLMATPASVNKLASALRDERMKSDIIVNAIEDGVVLFDDQLIIRSFNPAAAKITGWKASEAMNLVINTVIKVVNKKGEPYDPNGDPLKRVFTDKSSIRINDAELVTQAGKRIAISLIISPLTDESQKIFGALAVFRDVTAERAEESQRADFISTASHEMRTPVAAIEGYLALALNDKVSIVDSRARGYLEKAHASTKHLGQLFQDLLTSAKAEDGRLSSHPKAVEIGEYLTQLTEELRFVAEKKNLAMEFVAGSTSYINADTSSDNKVLQPLYYCLIDGDRMREVITNLFDNAVKYTDTGKITIGLTGNNEVVQIFIRDTGPGIPSEDTSHLFQKFYRVDNSATRTIGGTGLGLFICRKIVELYQGRIWVESQIGQGSTFFINLPRLSTQQAIAQQASEAQPQNAALPTINTMT